MQDNSSRPRSRARRIAFTMVIPFAFGTLGSFSASAQSARVVPAPLGSPTTTHLAEFTSITAVRELANGRVLVVDGGDQGIMLVDWSPGRAVPVGREGSGAGEYRAPRRLYELPNDSTLLPDARNGRWLLLHGATFVGQVTGDAPAFRSAGSSPIGADARGFLLSAAPRLIDGVPRMDSLNLIRTSRATGRTDTVGSVLVRPPTIPGGGLIDPSRPTAVVFNPLSVAEQAAMFADGWMVIARLSPYRVEWISPNGQRTRGMILPYDNIRVDQNEKISLLAREARQSGRAPRKPDEIADWPAVMPPFLQDALLPAPDGSLWVKRTPTKAHPETRYDVVGRNGQVVRQVTLEAAERVVGFGAHSIFTVKVDGDGLERLRRHDVTWTVRRSN